MLVVFWVEYIVELCYFCGWAWARMSLSRIAQTELEQKLKVEYPSQNNTKLPYMNTLCLYSSNKQFSQKWTVFFNYKWLKKIKSQTGEYSSETAAFRKKTAVFNSETVLVFFRNGPSTSISTVKTQSKQHSMVHSMACTWPAVFVNTKK